ncbi:MAG: two-component regulator propeller domain-containing protein [Caldilineaceae bacterium]
MFTSIRQCTASRLIAIFALNLALIWLSAATTPAYAQIDQPTRPDNIHGTGTTATRSALDNNNAGNALLAPLPPHFTHLTVDDGLTNNDITAVLQDRQGFLWIGTRDGLNRYDGYTVVTYRHEPGNPNSLPRNEVNALFEDHGGMLWIATSDGGITRYDPRLETFKGFHHEPDNPQSLGGNVIFSIHQTSDGQLWFGGPTISGLTRFDPITRTFAHYQAPPPEKGQTGLDFPRGAIMRMYTDHDGQLWLMTETALALYNAAADRFQVYPLPQDELATAFLRSLLDDVVLNDGADRFLVGGAAGLFWFDPHEGAFSPIADSPKGIEILHRDEQGAIWVGTHNGLYQFHPSTQQTQLVARHRETDATSLADSNITAILTDRGGLLWIGTRNGGLSRLDPAQYQFARYAYDPAYPHLLAEPQIQALASGSEGELWVATPHVLHRLRAVDKAVGPLPKSETIGGVGIDGTRLARIDQRTFQVTQYPLPTLYRNGEVVASTIFRLLVDHRGHLWLGMTGSTVLQFDPEQESFTTHELIEEPLPPGPPPTIAAIYEDGDHALWFAVSFVGLYRLDAARTEITAFRYAGRPNFFVGASDNIASATVMALTGDNKGYLWLGYNDGTISRFAPQRNIFTHYPSQTVLTGNLSRPLPPPGTSPKPRPGPPPPSHVAPRPRTLSPKQLAIANPIGWIEVLYWDRSANLLWIGERNGLARFDPATEQFTHYGSEAGLSNTFIVTIEQDQHGDLWLGTQHGLIRFDPEEVRAYTYTVADGLQDNQFSRLASWHSGDGKLLFGGSRGITSFRPDALVEPTAGAPVRLTTMRLYNVPVVVGADSPLQKALWATDALTLLPDQQVVAFEFAALNFAAPQQNRYRYRLDGLENAWNEVDDSRRFATYTSLHPGYYTFRVQGGDSNGNWHPMATTLAIHVLPQWWQTLWFRVLAIVALGAAVVSGYHYRTRAIELRNRLLEQQITERTAALRESEERFRGLATSAFEAILVHQAGVIVDANDAATELFGYDYAALVGMPIITRLKPMLPAMAVGAELTDVPVHYEIEGVRADGNTLPLEAHMRTVPYQGEEALVVALRDLTDRRATERQRQQLAALEERERIGRDLHDDLGQVIGYITMQAQTAQELLKQAKSVQAQSTLEALTEAAQSAHSSVRQYILGIRNQRPQNAALDFFTALDLYLEQVRERHGLTVHVSLPDELPEPLLSTQVETQLLRILQEAVTNVRKHAGVKAASIVFLLQPDELQVIVSDDGRGFTMAPIKEGVLDHEINNTQHITRADDSTSPFSNLHFGLDIMRERAAGVGGKLEIRSMPGCGVQLFVTMPRRLELHPHEELRGLRVLLVDDHPLYREGLRNMLAVRGIHVVGIAEDGQAAERLAHQLLPDLILMDIEMPNGDGVAATKAIKSALPEIKIVMLTVAASTEILLTALKHGASGYLLKNLATDQFFALLSEVLQGETVLSPRLTTSMITTLTAGLPAAEAQNGAPKEPLTKTSVRNEETIYAQLQQLTARQREVLDLIIQGLTNKEIARELHITERTVKYHIGLILEQMGVQSRYELMHLVQNVSDQDVSGRSANGNHAK